MGHVVCEDGYEVWVRNVHAIAYRDGTGAVDLFAEPLVGRGRSFAVRRADVPEVGWLTRDELLRRVAAAFDHAGWVLVVD